MNQARKDQGKLGGRPDTVDIAMVKRANEYIGGKYLTQGIIPTVEGLARYLKIHRQTLYEAPEFSDTLEELQTMQADMVLNGSLNNEYNPSIAKLILSAKHGYVERTQVDQSVSVTSQPVEAIASDFASYVKGKTQAIDSTATQQTEHSDQ